MLSRVYTFTRGRIAFLCGIQKVFHRQIIILLLLVLYGVPAALGPFWHTHASNIPVEPGCQTSCCTAGHCHSHFHASPSAKIRTKHAVRPARVHAANACHDDCLVCRFYAATPLIMPSMRPSSRNCLCRSLLIDGTSHRVPRPFCSAREVRQTEFASKQLIQS